MRVGQCGAERDGVVGGTAEQGLDVGDGCGVGEGAEGELVGAGAEIDGGVGGDGGEGDGVATGAAGDGLDVGDGGGVARRRRG